MSQLETLGITVDLGEERVARIREAFPELNVIVELDMDKVSETLADVDGFIGRGLHVKLLEDAPRLRWIQTQTAGADGVSLAYLEERGIVLTNGSGIHAPNLGEHIMGLILAFARGLPQLILAQKRHEWTTTVPQFEVDGQTLCVVGLGDIGLALAERASKMGMRVTGVRRRDIPCPDYIEQVATLETMDPLLAEADHVALCLPLTERTRQIIGRDRLELLKPGTYIYNIGRGELVDQDAMIDLLRSGHLAGAGLDVTTPEPLPADNPLWDMENVIITCHTGGRSPLRIERFIELVIDNISRYRSGQPLLNVVDPVEGY